MLRLPEPCRRLYWGATSHLFQCWGKKRKSLELWVQLVCVRFQHNLIFSHPARPFCGSFRSIEPPLPIRWSTVWVLLHCTMIIWRFLHYPRILSALGSGELLILGTSHGYFAHIPREISLRNVLFDCDLFMYSFVLDGIGPLEANIFWIRWRLYHFHILLYTMWRM